jgi:hypothetical protein
VVRLGAAARQTGHLWNSYIADRTIVSKTYATRAHLTVTASIRSRIDCGAGPLTRIDEYARQVRKAKERQEDSEMLDLVLLVLVLGLFVVSVGYTLACDRL